MNIQTQILEKIDKLGEITPKLATLESEVSTLKCVKTEIDTLKSEFNRLNESNNQLVLKFSTQHENEQKVQKRVLRKTGFEVIKDSGLISNKFDGGKKIELEITKAITAGYADGNVAQDRNIRWLPSSLQPYIHTLFDFEFTDTSELHYADITSTTLSIAASNTQGCFPVTESNLTVQAFESKPFTIRGYTTICDTLLEDYPALLEEVDALMRDALINEFDARVITQILTIGTPGNTTPSYTALAAQVNDATIMDLGIIHNQDIIALTRSRLGSNPVMLLHPINIARMNTTKTDANLQLYNMNPALPTVIGTLQLPTTQYILVDRNAVQIRLLRNVTVEIKGGSHSENASGTVGMHLSMRGHIIFRNIYSGGAIFGNINTELANYNQP